jgi:hypothetical protein
MRKTRQSVLAGDASPPVEELFLDEGLAHLAETLAGYGICGGNILFARKYLTTPYAYSFSDTNIYGIGDSAGRRGAMLLLLSWLFWRAGGMSVATDGTCTDTGGIAFLQDIASCPETGWSALEYASGLGTEEMLCQWLQYALVQDREPSFPADPRTGEPLGISAVFGPYEYTDGSAVTLGGLTPADPATSVSMAGNAVFCYEKAAVTDYPLISLTLASGESNASSILFSSAWYCLTKNVK